MLNPVGLLCSYISRRQFSWLRAMARSDTVVVNHAPGHSQVQLSFTYEQPEVNFQRVFNFNRSAEETVETLSGRIAANLERHLLKKCKKLPEERRAALCRPEVRVLLDGQPADPQLSCQQALVQQGGCASLLIGDSVYRLNVNPPSVVQLSLPEHVMAGFPVYPSRLELLFAERADCRFSWQHQIQDQWEEVGTGPSYLARAADVGHRLRLVCTPRLGDRAGHQVTAECKQPVQAGPGPCPFEQRHAFTRELTDENSYRVVSYNILADLYADSDFTRTVLHPYCPPYALHIDYRKQLILKEILGYNADVVCLQEVDRKVFDGDLTPMLATAGLQGCYTEKGGQVTEGLVCFWRGSKLKLLRHERLVLGEAISEDPLFSDVKEACSANQQLWERITKRTQTLQVLVFGVVTSSGNSWQRRLVVANTHLYFHPNADHIRALQVGVCVRHLQRLLEHLQTEEPQAEVALLFCGDFNSCPEFSVYRLMSRGRLEPDLPDFTSLPGEEVSGVGFSHPFRLESACGLPAYTNHVDKFVGCLDYIFYMTDKMAVQQVVPLPSDEEVTRYTALPSVVHPSDHLALVADLTWLSTASRR